MLGRGRDAQGASFIALGGHVIAEAPSGLEALVVQSAVVGRVARVTGLSRAVLADKRAKFVLTGALNTAVGFGCFVTYQYLIGIRFGYMWTLLLTHTTTVLFAFVTHRRLVFKVSGSVLRDLWRFESVYLAALGVNALLLLLMVEVAGLPVLAVQAAITVVNAVVSWLGHSRFSFRRKLGAT